MAFEPGRGIKSPQLQVCGAVGQSDISQIIRPDGPHIVRQGAVNPYGYVVLASFLVRVHHRQVVDTALHALIPLTFLSLGGHPFSAPAGLFFCAAKIRPKCDGRHTNSKKLPGSVNSFTFEVDARLHTEA